MNAHGVYVERRTLRGATTLSRDLADHLYTRPPHSKTVILADRPLELMGVVVKRWRKIQRYVQREHSSTLNTLRKQELTREIVRTDTMPFFIKPDFYHASTGVCFVPIRNAFEFPTACDTLYITRPVAESSLDLLSHWVFEHGLIVMYDAL